MLLHKLTRTGSDKSLHGGVHGRRWRILDVRPGCAEGDRGRAIGTRSYDHRPRPRLRVRTGNDPGWPDAFFAAAVAANSCAQRDAAGHDAPDRGSVAGSDVLADSRPDGCSSTTVNRVCTCGRGRWFIWIRVVVGCTWRVRTRRTTGNWRRPAAQPFLIRA